MISEENAQDILADTTVIELTASIGRGSFGLGYAALNLTAALARQGVDVYLGCVDPAEDVEEACEESGFPIERVIRGGTLGPSRLRFSPSLVHQLLAISRRKRVLVHYHGLWTYISRVAMKVREHHGCPLVISPHGFLESWALQLSPAKKAIASKLYEKKNLSTASCLWALSDQEKQSIRDYGVRGRIEVLPNGVNRAIQCDPKDVEAFRRKYDIRETSRILLFLGRITPKKGIPLLLKAFAANLAGNPDWTLVIAGSDEGNHIQEVRSLIQSLGIGHSVRLCGPVFGREKYCAFSAASLFILPSYSEGLPIAVLEAMEYGLPVIVTDTWAIPCTINEQIGWRVAAEQDAIQQALLEAMTMAVSDLAGIGANAKVLIENYFTWDVIAHKARALYGSLSLKSYPEHAHQ